MITVETGRQWPDVVRHMLDGLPTGFVPLEERTDTWGADDPCLILAKALG